MATLVVIGARRTGSSSKGRTRAPSFSSWLAAAWLDYFVGVPIGIVERRPVLGARRHVMSALFLLNALFFFRFFFHGNLAVDDVQRDPALLNPRREKPLSDAKSISFTGKACHR